MKNQKSWKALILSPAFHVLLLLSMENSLLKLNNTSRILRKYILTITMGSFSWMKDSISVEGEINKQYAIPLS